VTIDYDQIAPRYDRRYALHDYPGIRATILHAVRWRTRPRVLEVGCGSVYLEASTPGQVLAGCLRNRSAVAERAARLGGPFGIIPAGERWHDGTLRPSHEDLVAAGAIAAALPGTRSPETEAAVAVFAASSTHLLDSLMSCSSGRELVKRGFPEDVLMAAELYVDPVAPELKGGRFTSGPFGAVGR